MKLRFFQIWIRTKIRIINQRTTNVKKKSLKIFNLSFSPTHIPIFFKNRLHTCPMGDFGNL